MSPRRSPKVVLPLAPHGLPGHLVGFVEALRAQGIGVGPSETVDAGRVMAELGFGDRGVLAEGLACALLRRPDHRATFDVLFDLWFPPALGARYVHTGPADPDAHPDSVNLPDLKGPQDPESIERVRDRLAELLADGAGDAALNSLISQIVEAFGRYSSTRGTSYSAYQALKSLSLEELEAKLLVGLLGGDGGPERSPMDQAIANDIAKQRVSKVRQLIEAETKRRMAEQLGRDRVSAYGVPQLAENVEFLRASGEQLRNMRTVVQPLARMLASRLAARRRRAHRGQIDLRRTLRKSMSTGGVPIDVVQRKPRPARPELVVLCDVSGSVAGFSHFTLLLVHALRQQFSRVRVFAFIDTTDEVTELFTPDTDLADAIVRMTREAQVFTGDGHSDYGHAFKTFVENFPAVLSPRSALLILGDARTNYRNPALEVLKTMVSSSRHAYWLNPEPKNYWGSGDSAATRYQQVIPMHECRSAKQLAGVIDSLLPT